MSLFGNTSSVFGAPATSAAPTTGFFGTGGTFAATLPTAAKVAPGFGAPAAQGQPMFGASTAGLGGNSASLLGPPTGGSLATQSYVKPKDTPLPAELLAVVETLKTSMRTNKQLSDEMDAAMTTGAALAVGDEAARQRGAVAALAADVRRTGARAAALRRDGRADVQRADAARRLNDALPIAAVAARNNDPVQYLHELTSEYEKEFVAIGEQLQVVERRVFDSAGDTQTDADLLEHLKRLEGVFESIAAKVRRSHDAVDASKVQLVCYRRQLYGESVPSPFAPSKKEPLPSDEDERRGPNPFPPSSDVSALLRSAAYHSSPLRPLQASAPLPSTLFSTPAQTQPSIFGNISQAAGAPLFKPFSTTPAASTAGAFGVGAFGAPAAATTGQQASPFRFSSPFSTSTSGTLFGGAAANVAAVRPFGK